MEQISSTTAQMFRLVEATLGFPSDSDKTSSTSSSSSNRDGIEVRVGRPPRLVHVPHSALKACRMLRTRLVHGCRIMNTDASVFEVVLAYLNSNGFLTQLRLSVRNPLTQLTGGSDRMLKLAIAWHLADMLDDIRLQNKLVDVYRTLYLELLDAQAGIPLDHEAFIYLESHIGTHTKIEKFMIDFFAGLSRYTGHFSAQKFLPLRPDISQALEVRRSQLVVLGTSVDMIATGSTCFNVTKSDPITHCSLHVVKPRGASSSADLNFSPTQHSFSTSSLSSLGSPPVSPTCDRRHQGRLSPPGTMSVPEQREVLLYGTLASILQSPIGMDLRSSHTQSVSLKTPVSRRAPFMEQKPVFCRQQADVDSEDDFSGEDTMCALFSPDLLRHDFSQELRSGVMTDIPTAWS